jgi:SAM-dependent methyltransferase
MPDRIAEHYQRHAHAFDAARSKSLVERDWLDRFLLPLPKGAAVLDLGCGAGEPIARYLIDHGVALTGVDIAANMVALARTRFGRHRWIEGDMRSIELDEDAYDGVIAWGSLFHLEHDAQAAMFPRVALWLKRGGVFLFTTGSEHGEMIGEFAGEPLYHASFELEQYRTLLAQSGLTEVAHRLSDPSCGDATVWLAGKF